MSLFGALNRRVFGFRAMELGATLVLTALVITVYMAKTGAGDKTDDIDRITQQIQDTQTQIHLLKAQVANEEQPERLTRLSARYLNLAPIGPKQEIDADGLAGVAQPAAPVRTAVAQSPATPSSQAAPLQPAAYTGPPILPGPARTGDR
jgi:hypothetical protein